ncbi:hypothetical protein SBV1_1320026 [Verrucomicrobia bacterium]|nr:hypothetical protein SBV1_1320026 [Verrucomicrobiota bacterium]
MLPVGLSIFIIFILTLPDRWGGQSPPTDEREGSSLGWGHGNGAHGVTRPTLRDTGARLPRSRSLLPTRAPGSAAPN